MYFDFPLDLKDKNRIKLSDEVIFWFKGRYSLKYFYNLLKQCLLMSISIHLILFDEIIQPGDTFKIESWYCPSL